MGSAISREAGSKNPGPEDYFDPGEIAILRAYFGLEPRPGDPPLSELYEPFYTELYVPEPFPNEDDEPRVYPSVPIRLRPTKEVERVNELSEAVARICLGEVQHRLPQYWGSNDHGSRLRFPTPERTKPLEPVHVLSIVWAFSAPGFDWPEVYYATLIPGFERYIVTASVDSIDGYGVLDFALGWFSEAEGLLEGSRRLVADWWRANAELDGGPWAEASSGDVMTEDEAEELRTAIWPHADDGGSAA